MWRRLGAERSLVQIQLPRLTEARFRSGFWRWKRRSYGPVGGVVVPAVVPEGAAPPVRVTRTGTTGGDRIFVGTGDDIVDGLPGDDCIDLGPGNDRAQGGLGADLIHFGHRERPG